MVSHRHRVHPITRQPSRGINRRQQNPLFNIFSRIRVLTPEEINQRILANWEFFQIDPPQEPITPPPLLRQPSPFHGPGSPTQDIIEFPLPIEERYPPENQLPIDDIPIPTTDVIEPIPAALAESAERPAIGSDEDDDRETIPFLHDVDFADLSNWDDLSDLYEPVSSIYNAPLGGDNDIIDDPTLSQLIDDILSNEDEEYQFT